MKTLKLKKHHIKVAKECRERKNKGKEWAEQDETYINATFDLQLMLPSASKRVLCIYYKWKFILQLRWKHMETWEDSVQLVCAWT